MLLLPSMLSFGCIHRVGQNHLNVYGVYVYIRHSLQGFLQIHGHIWRIFTALANPVLTH